MADNILVTPGVGATVAADDIGGALHQRVKIVWGVDGAGVDASASNPLPVVQTGTPALPTGAATDAGLTTIAGHLDNVETLLTAIDGRVDGLETLVAATNTALATGATTLLKAADAVPGATDTGIPPLAIRTNTPAAITPANGDYAPLRVDANGGLWVAGSQIEDAAAADGDRGLGMLAVRQDALSASVGTDGDYAFIKVDSLGRVWTAGIYLEDAAHSTGHAGMQMLTVRADVAAATSGTDGDYQPPITDARGRMHVRESLDEYETVAASQSDQILGATGAQFDLLAGVLVIPATTSPGAVSIKDGNGSAITIFAGGASSVLTLHPFFVPLGLRALAGTSPGWKITTGANVSCIGIGDFT